jgi:hypothetical protein
MLRGEFFSFLLSRRMRAVTHLRSIPCLANSSSSVTAGASGISRISFTGWTDVDLGAHGRVEELQAGKELLREKLTFDIALPRC